MPETHSASAEPSATNGQSVSGQATDGQATDGQPVNGQATNGEVETDAADAANAGDKPASPSWFEPAAPAAEAHTTEWFLRTGRAGLRPDSVTESWEDDEESHATERPVTAANPPWAGDSSIVADDSPPPWESGPWPGPGEDHPVREQVRDDARTAQKAGPVPLTGPAGNWQATAALGTGILPLVIPGLVFGVLGLRRAAVAGVGRTWSLIGIGLSVIWAVVLAVYLATGGQAAPACGAAENGVTSAVSQVLRDLGTAAPQSALTQDLRTAINQANSAAAASANQIGVRNALVGLTSGLQRAQQEATASPRRVSDATMRAQVDADLSAVTAACKA
jgi:hypothetical protein